MSEKNELTLKKASTHVRDSTTDESPFTTLCTPTPDLRKQSTLPSADIEGLPTAGAPVLRKH